MSDRLSRSSPILPTLVLALLLGASILAIQPAEAFPVSAGQKSTVESLFGPGAPFTTWEARSTALSFYLHSGPTGSAGPPPVEYSTPATVPNPNLDAFPPEGAGYTGGVTTIPTSQAAPAGNQVAFGVASGGAVLFPMVDDLRALDTYTVNNFASTVWIACNFANPTSIGNPTGAGTVNLVTVRASLIAQEVKDGGWVKRAELAATNLNHPSTAANTGSAGTAPGVASPWSGSTAVGNSGLLTGAEVKPGERLVAQYTVAINAQLTTVPGVGDPMCILYYDFAGNPSRITLTTNAMRVALLTTNLQREHTTAFPSAGTIPPAQQRFVVEALQATAFGSTVAQQLKDKHTNLRLFDVDAQEVIYYMDDHPFDNECGTGCSLEFPRDYEVQKGVKLVTSRGEQLVPEPDIETDIGNGVLRRSFVFSYDNTLPEHAIEPQLYAYPTSGGGTDGWERRGDFFRFGGKGIAFEVPSFETGVHTINPLEPTEFAFLLRNTGTTDDSITVSVASPGDGWTARVLGGGMYFLKAGGVAIGTVEVVPAPNAVAGAQKTVTVTASSQFPEVDDPSPITFTTVLSNTVTRGVDVSVVNSVFQVSPNTAKSFPVTLVNKGSRRDSFTIIPSFPSSIQGWTVVAVPSSVQVPAGGISQIQVSITPAPEAQTGMTFPLGLTAVEVGNSLISDRVDVTVDVFARAGILAEVFDAATNRTMRNDAPDACVDTFDPILCQTGTSIPDTDFDNTALFRVPVTNLGDRAANYKVEANWDLSVPGSIDDSFCDALVYLAILSSSDGVPDGWRFNYGAGKGAIPALGSPPTPADDNSPVGDHGVPANNGGFSGYYNLNTTENPVRVPARTTVPIYFELGWLEGDPCPANDVNGESSATMGSEADFNILSPRAGLKVRVTDLNDPSITSTTTLIAENVDPGTFQGTGRYSAATHAVLVEPAPNAKTSMAVSDTQAGVFDLVAVNKANEKDGLKITVNGAPGWTHGLVAKTKVPAGLPCELPAADGSITCLNLGVFDEVHFQVVATPTGEIDVGDVDPITVTVQSIDAPGIARTLSLVARASGTYDFDLLPRGATTRSVQAGQTVSFPFMIDNEGTADDSYRLSLLTGSPTWQPTLSSSAPVFVPAGREIPGLLTVTGPASSPAGTSDTFRIKVESVGGGTIKTFEATSIVQPASGLAVFGKDGQDVLVAQRNVDTSVTVRAIQVSGTPASQVTFTVDKASLPPRWTVDRETATVSLSPEAGGRPAGEAVFKVRAPADALGTAHGLLHVDAATVGTSPIRSGTDLRLNLASTFGVEINATDPINGTKLVIAPGGPAVFNLTVNNRGLGSDVITLSNTPVPAGWTLLFNPGTMSLGPLQKRTVEVTLTAPASAKPADIASIVVFAASANDPKELDSVPLSAQVGFNALSMKLVQDGIRKAAPQESNVWVVNLTNTGTLPDEVHLVGKIDTTALGKFINGTVEPQSVKVDPNQTVQVRVVQAFGEAIPSNVTAVGSLTATSILDERTEPAFAKITLTSKVLPYAANDVNRDSRRDFAVDRNEDPTDGFEEFRVSQTPGGLPIQAADLQRFLSDAAREGFSRDVVLANGTTQRTLLYVIDGDDDQKVDHFLDADGDGQPDFYWDPDANQATSIDFRKDVNGDQVPESFVDTDGDGEQDAVFDLTRGTFTDVIQVDVDGDGKLDYVVDKDGDGQVDQDETVLYTRTGGLLIVQKVDVDGDGKLDQVFDTDGDGNPDYFIPNGSTDAVAITMRDVNGDGVQDWTFDGDNDGRKESYYDPATGEAHVINAAGHFGDALKEYWYVSALFALVLVLFVALVLVTRR